MPIHTSILYIRHHTEPSQGIWQCKCTQKLISNDFGQPFYCTYDGGTDRLPQPKSMYQLPISLWNLALEVHTGRIFTFLGTVGSFLYIFLAGLLVLWILITGWLIRIKKRKKIGENRVTCITTCERVSQNRLSISTMAIRISATPSTFLKIRFNFILQKVP